MTESDGLNEIFDELVQHGISTSARVLEVVQQHRAVGLQQQAAKDEQQARQHRAKLAVERSIAIVKLGAVDDPQWWTKAGEEDVRELWQVADSWRDHDAQIAAHGEQLRRETIERRGFDPDERFGDHGRDVGELARVTQARPAAEAVTWSPRAGSGARSRGQRRPSQQQQRDRSR
jgi:hypothetical protein